MKLSAKTVKGIGLMPANVSIPLMFCKYGKEKINFTIGFD